MIEKIDPTIEEKARKQRLADAHSSAFKKWFQINNNHPFSIKEHEYHISLCYKHPHDATGHVTCTSVSKIDDIYGFESKLDMSIKVLTDLRNKNENKTVDMY